VRSIRVLAKKPSYYEPTIVVHNILAEREFNEHSKNLNRKVLL